MNQKKLDRYFMKVAQLTAELSHAKRMKVGAVLVRDNRIISVGYNGTPEGFDNTCEDAMPDGTLKTKSTVIHAESNALFFCAKTNTIADGATMYQTLSPCACCALGIIQSGIRRLVYLEQYRDVSGIEILKKAGIKVEQLSLDR